MKRLILIGLLLLAPAVHPAAPFTNVATLRFNMTGIDNTQMGGLSTNDFSTNFAAVFVTSINVAVPTNLWTTALVVPVATLLAQGPVGTIWTNQIQLDSSTRFFMLQYTNLSNGGVGPFSNPYPLIWNQPSGGLGITK